METQKIHRAFGYIIFQNDVESGTTSKEHGIVNSNMYRVEGPYNPHLTKEYYKGLEHYNHVWVYTNGRIQVDNLDNGTFFECGPGYCTLEDPHPVGNFRVNFLEPTTFFCLGPEANLDKTPIMPEVSFFKLEAGNSVKMSNCNLFFCGGKMQVNDLVVNKPSQLKIQEEKEFYAIDTVYGLIFH